MDFRQPNELLCETIMTKDMDDLIDSRVSLKQCKKAVDALHSFTTKQQQKEEADQLLPGKEQYVWLNVNVKKISPTRKLKPTKMCVDLIILVLYLTMCVDPLYTLSSTLAHLGSASSRRILKESTKISSRHKT